MMRVGMGRWSLAAMPIAGIVVALVGTPAFKDVGP
jgi:hypothetical protein